MRAIGLDDNGQELHYSVAAVVTAHLAEHNERIIRLQLFHVRCPIPILPLIDIPPKRLCRIQPKRSVQRSSITPRHKVQQSKYLIWMPTRAFESFFCELGDVCAGDAFET